MPTNERGRARKVKNMIWDFDFAGIGLIKIKTIPNKLSILLLLMNIIVIPTKAGIQWGLIWIPAFAGMTTEV
jgi:Flp pilus assembly protein protease CpaA